VARRRRSRYAGADRALREHAASDARGGGAGPQREALPGGPREGDADPGDRHARGRSPQDPRLRLPDRQAAPPDPQY